jgi:nucleoside-triphosphatase THEP1
MTNYKNILLTGVPAIGKTTLIKRICHLINNKYSDRFLIKGFYTQEVRNGINYSFVFPFFF